MEEDCCSTQLIYGNGDFNVIGLDNFTKTINLAERGLSYAVVAIIGPQSSGKSTLLNYLFHTNFREMDAFEGRNKTTSGIWIAKAVGIEPCTIVLDVEGTDGRERGEDDTTFEKQSALFALAIADIVLINIWCHDIGREHASNKPLLKTVFQVMMRLFSPRKTTLLFVIRDKTKTPFEYLEPILKEDVRKIWDAVPKPIAHKRTPFSEVFKVEVTALSSYESNEKQFKEQVAHLRQRFFSSIAPGGLAGDRCAAIPASGFSYSLQQIWKVIQENKDLDLPSHKVMVATVRCEEIANEMFSCFTSDELWLKLEETTKSAPVSGFGKQLSSLLESYLSRYDMATIYFDEGVQNAKRKELETKLLKFVKPAYVAMLGHLRSKASKDFKTGLEKCLSRGEGFAAAVHKCAESCMLEFDRGCADAAVELADWDATKVREKLAYDVETHACSVCNMNLSKLIADYEKRLALVLVAAVESLLESGRSDSWASIRNLLKYETEVAVAGFLTDVASFELDQSTCDQMVHSLRDYARGIVEKKARDEAGKVLIHMKDRFFTIFNHDEDANPRVWTGREDIKAIARRARSEALRVMSSLAAIRLDEKPDRIEDILFTSLMGKPADLSFLGRCGGVSEDLLVSRTWDRVSPSKVLITPVQCKTLWRQFCAETEYMVTQAISAQEAHRQSDNWLPPPWVIMTMIVLGFNEFMMLLRNPLYLLVLFLLYLLAKAIWRYTNIAKEIQHGTLYSWLSLSSKLVTTMMGMVRWWVEAQEHATPEAAGLPSDRKSFIFKEDQCRTRSTSSSEGM